MTAGLIVVGQVAAAGPAGLSGAMINRGAHDRLSFVPPTAYRVAPGPIRVFRGHVGPPVGEALHFQRSEHLGLLVALHLAPPPPSHAEGRYPGQGSVGRLDLELLQNPGGWYLSPGANGIPEAFVDPAARGDLAPHFLWALIDEISLTMSPANRFNGPVYVAPADSPMPPRTWPLWADSLFDKAKIRLDTLPWRRPRLEIDDIP